MAAGVPDPVSNLQSNENVSVLMLSMRQVSADDKIVKIDEFHNHIRNHHEKCI